MTPPARAVFLWRAAHLILLPVLLVATGGAGAAPGWSALMASPGRVALGRLRWRAPPSWLLARRAGARRLVDRPGPRRAHRRRRCSSRSSAQPLSRQTAAFPKVATARRGAAREAT